MNGGKGNGFFLVIMYMCLGLVILGSIYVLHLTWGEQTPGEGRITQIQNQTHELLAMPDRTCVLANERTAYRFIRVDRDKGLLDDGGGKKWPVDADHPLHFGAKFYAPGREGYGLCTVRFFQQ